MERYTRILSIQNKLFQQECPLIFDKGALLKDNKLQSNILQLQFINTGYKRVVAVYIKIECYDIENQKLDCVQFHYLDLKVNYGDTFGSDVGIGISQNTARRFELSVYKIFFDDKSAPDYSGKMIPLKEGTPISSLGVLEAQFKRDVRNIIPNENCILCPTVNNWIWYCTCGAVNYKDNCVCGTCKIDKKCLFAILDIERLKENNSKYLEAMEKEREKKEEEKKETEIKIRKMVKRISILACMALILIGISSWLVDMYVSPWLKYNDANSYEEKQYYKEAMDLYSELGEYKDSGKRKNICKYNLVKEKFAAGEYSSVIDILSTSDDLLYEDVELLEKYSQAKILYMQGLYNEAIDLFKELDDYLDSKKQISEIKYMMALQLYQEKKYSEAYEILAGVDAEVDSEEVVELWKNCGEALGDIEYAEGNYEEAVRYYREVKSSTKASVANKALQMEPIVGVWEGVVGGHPTIIWIMLDGTWSDKMGNAKVSSLGELSYSTAMDSWVIGNGTFVYLRDGDIEVKGLYNFDEGDCYRFKRIE